MCRYLRVYANIVCVQDGFVYLGTLTYIDVLRYSYEAWNLRKRYSSHRPIRPIIPVLHDRRKSESNFGQLGT